MKEDKWTEVSEFLAALAVRAEGLGLDQEIRKVEAAILIENAKEVISCIDELYRALRIKLLEQVAVLDKLLETDALGEEPES